MSDSPDALTQKKRPPADPPRRAYINLMVPAELAIREAMLAVERMPADVRLTAAVVKLGEASALVSEYVDREAETDGHRPND